MAGKGEQGKNRECTRMSEFSSCPLVFIRGSRNLLRKDRSSPIRPRLSAPRRTLAQLVNLIIVAFIALQSCFGPLTKDDYGDFGRLEGGFL